jgi:catalase-peroxidase
MATENNDTLSNDWFVKLLDMSVAWKPNGTGNSYEGVDRVSGEKVSSATRVDLVFGSNSQLRALAEVYASDDAQEKLVSDFIAAWNKVMNNDMF